jgi:hypothetical protein
MTKYDPWIPRRLLAIGTHGDLVSISSINSTTGEMVQIYQYNDSISATPTVMANPTEPNNGIMYFMANTNDAMKSKVVSYTPRAKFGDWVPQEQSFFVVALGFYRPREFDEACVYVLANHGDYLDVGKLNMTTGVFRTISARFPAGTISNGVAAYNQNNGIFYAQLQISEGGYDLVACALPNGIVTSAPIASGYKIESLQFDAGRSALVGVFAKAGSSFCTGVVNLL